MHSPMEEMQASRTSYRATDTKIGLSCLGVSLNPELSQENLQSCPCTLPDTQGS